MIEMLIARQNLFPAGTRLMRVSDANLDCYAEIRIPARPAKISPKLAAYFDR